MLQECVGFEWNEGNFKKNWSKHNVSHVECEQVFFNYPLLVYDDKNHSENECRMYVLGKTDARVLLFIAFTIRNKLIRVISARNMSKKERKIYEQCSKEEITQI